MLRRMEDRIRKLCAALLAEQDPVKSLDLAKQLRDELHRCVEKLRTKVREYPFVMEYPFVKERRRATSVASDPPSTATSQAIEAAPETETPLISKAG